MELPFHTAFTFNGLQYESKEELYAFAEKLQQEGDEYEMHIGDFLTAWLDDTETVTVQTSGSTGKPKKIKLRKQAMVNSAKATAGYFKLGAHTSALLCMSANYIAGKMMLVRAMVMGWNLHVVAPGKDVLTQYDNEYDFVAMVPYQVHHSLASLDKVKKLIIGGGPVSKELDEQLQNVSTEAFATYGMTETITHVAVKRVNGPASSKSFSALPNIKFSQDERDCLVISAPDISEEKVSTNDVVTLQSPTSFIWLGRYDNVINSGGVKIFPEKVEEMLSTSITEPFIIASEKDTELGERIILVMETKAASIPDYSNAFQILSKYECPKKIISLSKFPYTETGKIKRGAVLELLRKYK